MVTNVAMATIEQWILSCDAMCVKNLAGVIIFYNVCVLSANRCLWYTWRCCHGKQLPWWLFQGQPHVWPQWFAITNYIGICNKIKQKQCKAKANKTFCEQCRANKSLKTLAHKNQTIKRFSLLIQNIHTNIHSNSFSSHLAIIPSRYVTV